MDIKQQVANAVMENDEDVVSLDWYVKNRKTEEGEWYGKYIWLFWYEDEYNFDEFRSTYKDFERHYIDWKLYTRHLSDEGRMYCVYEVKRAYLNRPFIMCMAESSKIQKDDV